MIIYLLIFDLKVSLQNMYSDANSANNMTVEPLQIILDEITMSSCILICTGMMASFGSEFLIASIQSSFICSNGSPIVVGYWLAMNISLVSTSCVIAEKWSSRFLVIRFLVCYLFVMNKACIFNTLCEDSEGLNLYLLDSCIRSYD